MSDDTLSADMTALFMLAKMRDDLVEEVSQRIVGLMEADFNRAITNNNTRIAADILVDYTRDHILADLKSAVETKWTQWIVDNKVHF